MALDPRIIVYSLMGICLLCALGTIILTALLFRQYFENWTQPRTQTLVMRVILLVPVWAILGTVNAALPDLRYFVAIFLDLYEGFAILTFMQLIYHYLGGRDQAQWKAAGKDPYRCLAIFCYVYPGETLMKFLHVFIYQYAFTRPFLAILTCIFYYNGIYEEGGLKEGKPVGVALTGTMLFSLFLAMWGLLQVYRIFKLILAPNNVGSKFMAIKIFILLHAIQGFVFAALESNQEEEQRKQLIVRLEYTVVCIEMLIGAYLNKRVFFKYNEYIDPDLLDDNEKIRLESKNKSNYSASRDLLAGDN